MYVCTHLLRPSRVINCSMGAQTKRPETKRPETKRPWTKRPWGQNVHRTKRPADKTSARTKRPWGQNVRLGHIYQGLARQKFLLIKIY